MISLELWRARIGCFLQPCFKSRFKAPKIAISAMSLRLFIWVSLTLAISTQCNRPGVPNVVQWQLDLFTQDCNVRDVPLDTGHTMDYLILQSTHMTALITRMSLCGDVELNPGPNPSGPSKQTGNTSRVQTRLSSLQGQLAIGNMDIDLVSELKESKDRLKVLELENEKLKSVVDRLENQSRRNNLILHGIDEQENESWESCETKVKQVLQDEFGIDATNLPIERAHRLGKPKPVLGQSVNQAASASQVSVEPSQSATGDEGTAMPDKEEGPPKPKSRPVIIKFLNWKDKSSVMRQVLEAKSENVKASEDYSLTVRNIRKQLIPHLIDLRNANPGKTVVLSFDKIRMGKKVFSLSDFKE